MIMHTNVTQNVRKRKGGAARRAGGEAHPAQRGGGPAKPGRGVQPKPPEPPRRGAGGSRPAWRVGERRPQRPPGRVSRVGGEAPALPQAKRGAPWFAPRRGEAEGRGSSPGVPARLWRVGWGERAKPRPTKRAERAREGACEAGCPALARGGTRTCCASAGGEGAGEPPKAGAKPPFRAAVGGRPARQDKAIAEGDASSARAAGCLGR